MRYFLQWFKVLLYGLVNQYVTISKIQYFFLQFTVKQTPYYLKGSVCLACTCCHDKEYTVLSFCNGINRAVYGIALIISWRKYGIVIAITALIPIFGAFIGCVIGMLLIVMVDPVQAVWFLVLFLVLQQIEGNLIYPHVVGSSVGLPSIWVLVAVTVGGNMFGILGILVFIPLCSVLYALFAMFVKKRLREREVPESRWNAQSGGAAAAGPEVSDKTGGSGNTAG